MVLQQVSCYSFAHSKGHRTSIIIVVQDDACAAWTSIGFGTRHERASIDIGHRLLVSTIKIARLGNCNSRIMIRCSKEIKIRAFD